MINYTVLAQLSYLTLAIIITVWVGRTLFKHGRIFLVDTFGGNKEFADAVNHLLVVGFYLINVGYAVITLGNSESVADMARVIDLTAARVGRVILVLGGMHFLNLYIFSRMRRRSMLHGAPPPVVAREHLAKGA